MLTKADVYLIWCSTGCSCCSNENRYRGPYPSQEIADGKVAEFRAQPLLASQYARSGVYQIEKCSGEVLPDGRIIVDDTVYEGFET